MKRKIIMIISVLLIAVLMIPLTGCTLPVDTSAPDTVISPDTDIYDIQWTDMFEKIGSDNHFYVYRETTTDVMYMQYRERNGYGGCGGLTVMLNTDGTPLLYSEYVAMNSCDNCGALCHNGFCSKCGAGLNASPNAPETTEPSAPETTVPKAATPNTCDNCNTACDTPYCSQCGAKQ